MAPPSRSWLRHEVVQHVRADHADVDDLAALAARAADEAGGDLGRRRAHVAADRDPLRAQVVDEGAADAAGDLAVELARVEAADVVGLEDAGIESLAHVVSALAVREMSLIERALAEHGARSHHGARSDAHGGCRRERPRTSAPSPTCVPSHSTESRDARAGLHGHVRASAPRPGPTRAPAAHLAARSDVERCPRDRRPSSTRARRVDVAAARGRRRRGRPGSGRPGRRGGPAGTSRACRCRSSSRGARSRARGRRARAGRGRSRARSSGSRPAGISSSVAVSQHVDAGVDGVGGDLRRVGLLDEAQDAAARRRSPPGRRPRGSAPGSARAWRAAPRARGAARSPRAGPRRSARRR